MIDDDDAIKNILSSSGKLLPGNEEEDVEFVSTIGVLDVLRDLDQKADEDDYIGKPPKKRKKKRKKKKKKDDEAFVDLTNDERNTKRSSGAKKPEPLESREVLVESLNYASRSTSGSNRDLQSVTTHRGSQPLVAATSNLSSKDEIVDLLDSGSDSDSDDGASGKRSSKSRRVSTDQGSKNEIIELLDSNTKRSNNATRPSSKQAAASKGHIVEWSSSRKLPTQAKRQRPKNHRSTGSLLVDSRSTGSNPFAAASSSSSKPMKRKALDDLTNRTAKRSNNATRPSSKQAAASKGASTNSKPRSSDKPASKPGKSSEDEKYGIGPFGHLYDKDSIELIQKFILEMIELHKTIKDTKAHHFDGLYPLVPFEKLADVATIIDIISCAHPLVFETVMEEGFDATAILKKTLRAIETATLKDGKIAEEYQVDLESLPKRHCNKDIIPQTDASKFANSYSGGYLMGFDGTFGEFKTRATSWLRHNRNESKGEKRLHAFLQVALSRHRSLCTSDDANVSIVYPGTTSRSFDVRWAEHESESSDSLNSAFHRIFPKTFQFGIMFSPTGDIASSLIVEAFLSGIFQTATLRTLLKANPKATFSFQGCDGESLTLTNGGINMNAKGSDGDVAKLLSSMITQHGGDTLLSRLDYLPSFITESIECNIDAIISYFSGTGRCLETPAQVHEESSLGMILSYYKHKAGVRGYETRVQNEMKSKNISEKEAKTAIGKHGMKSVKKVVKERGMDFSDYQRSVGEMATGKAKSKGLDISKKKELLEAVAEEKDIYVFDCEGEGCSCKLYVKERGNKWEKKNAKEATKMRCPNGCWPRDRRLPRVQTPRIPTDYWSYEGILENEEKSRVVALWKTEVDAHDQAKRDKKNKNNKKGADDKLYNK